MTSHAEETIFVTGGSGFLASHVVVQLLEAGYHVRATARGDKVGQLKQKLARFGDKLEVVDVPDIAKGTFPLEGVDAVMHTASPLPGAGDVQKILDGAIEGSINILRQTHAAGIKRFIYTGSIVATFTGGPDIFTDKGWADTKLDPDEKDLIKTYRVSKTLAEQAVWDFREKHPEMDITVFNPPWLFGPLSEGLPIADKPTWSTISTDLYVLHLISPHAKFPRLLGYLDVRDAARAHILALNSKNPDPSRKKRLPIGSPHAINYDEVLQLIVAKRPELQSRVLPGPAPHYTKAQIVPRMDLQRVEDVVGLKPSEYHSLESTILDSIDTLLDLEKFWAAKGHDVRAPLELL